jgi:RHS repeat-associated protein
MLLVVLTVLLALPQTLHARWYDAEAGRWLTRDPAGYIDGPNAVEYVASAPIARSDPMGLAMGIFLL